MKTIKIILVLCGLVVTSFAQEKGIHFREFDNWETLIETSKKEKKPIFIDIFTTWCGPCKSMDSDVYGDKKVGDYLNKNFISIKLQFDKTADDSDQVKKWHLENRKLQTTFDVTAYPTLLFLSPSGAVLAKTTGFKPVEEFLKIAVTSLKPGVEYIETSAKYFKAIQQYREGSRNGADLSVFIDSLVLPSIITTFPGLNKVIDSLTATNLQYLRTLPTSSLFKREILETIGRSFLEADDPLFIFFLKNRIKINEIVGRNNFADLLIDRGIAQKYITPSLSKSIKNKSKLNLDSLRDVVKGIYGEEHALRVVGAAEIAVNWNALFSAKPENKDFLEQIFFQSVLEQRDKYGIYSLLIYPTWMKPHEIHRYKLDHFAHWTDVIFCYYLQRSSDVKQIISGIGIMEDALKYVTEQIKTPYLSSTYFFSWSEEYAMLLAKSGSPDKAINALRLAIDYGKKTNMVAQNQIEKLESKIKFIENEAKLH